jgi:hypothetical protein
MLREWKELEEDALNVQKDHARVMIGDPAEVFSVGSDGDVEGEDGDQDVSEISGDEEETVLGESFLGEGVLCEHDRVG